MGKLLAEGLRGRRARPDLRREVADLKSDLLKRPAVIARRPLGLLDRTPAAPILRIQPLKRRLVLLGVDRADLVRPVQLVKFALIPLGSGIEWIIGAL